MSVFRSLQFRLLLLLIVVATVPIGVISAINLSTATSLVTGEISARQLEVSQIVAEQVSHFIEDIIENLQNLGRGSFALDLDRDGINSYISSYLDVSAEGQNIYRNVWLMDAEGNELGGIVAGRTISVGELSNRAEDEIFFRPERGETYFSNVRIINNAPQISVSVPIYDASGTFIGVAAAVIELEETWETVRNLQLGESGYALLLDRRGNVIVHKDNAVLEARYNLAEAPPFAAALRNQALEVYDYQSPIAGEVLATALSIQGPNWVLLLERPKTEAFAPIFQAQNNIFLGLVLAILVSAGISVLLSRSIAHPIERLRDIVQQFGSGDLRIRSDIQSADEIGQLSTGFNAMAERLETRIEEIDSKNQELQIANEKVLESSRLKDEFLAVMSHELRTPLNAIIGFTGILLMDSELSEKQSFQLQRVEANSERLLHLINDVLDISRIQAGRMSFNPVSIDVRRVIQRLHAQLDILAKNKGLHFSYEIAEDIPKILTVDEDAFLKILTNLCSNAIKFTSAGSITIRLERDENELFIHVKDTGIGIPIHMQEIIFDEFRQVDGSSMRAHGGTGLGLAIVRRISNALDGNVYVQSKVGEGSTFTVNLPLFKAETELLGEAHA